MKIRIDNSKCKECEKCVENCPVGAISKQGFIEVDNSRCIKCKMCLISCPFGAISAN